MLQIFEDLDLIGQESGEKAGPDSHPTNQEDTDSLTSVSGGGTSRSPHVQPQIPRYSHSKQDTDNLNNVG